MPIRRSLSTGNHALGGTAQLPKEIVLSESEHIYGTSLYVRENINDIKQHYPDEFYNPAITRLYRLKEFVEGVAE